MKIKEISGGVTHTVVSTGKIENFKFNFPENDGIFSFGSNEYGQLGIGENIKDDQFTPQKVTFFDKMKIKQISCGHRHTLILTGSEDLITNLMIR